MKSKIRQCVFVVSHPRSGTHLLIDFIRRNFPAFNPKLRPWESASKLYLNVDHSDWRQQAEQFLRQGRTHVLLKSHLAGHTSQADSDVKDVLDPQQEVFLYPFRKFSRVVKSYAEFTQSPPPISKILTEKDWFFGRVTTVAESIRGHAERWIERDIHSIDCELLSEDPETASTRLGVVLGHTPIEIAQRLPRRRLRPGKIGEFIERVSGRQSTEVLVPYKLQWQSPDEELFVDSQFSDLHAELSKRRIN
jgi:hypothetical protein